MHVRCGGEATRMIVWLLFSFASCATLLVLGEASTLSDEDQVIQCSETKVKVYDQCLSEANLCQAVKNFSLALICSLCDDNDTVLWYFSPGSQKDHFHNLSQKNKTLFLAAVDVTKDRASGCYQCLCQGSELNVMYFSVQVELPVPPTFLVDVVNDWSPTNFDLSPPIRNVPLVETSPGVVCINCSAIGYPNLRYTWTYTDFGGDWKNVSSDPCMKFQDDQSEVLCFTPTIQNLLEQLTYQCEVSNIFQTVTAQQTIIYPGSADSSDWFVRPHQLQSRGEIPLTNGVSTAICAAYQQTEVWVQVEYYVCALPGTADANESACLFDSLSCCSCRDESCPLGINVTQDTFVDSLGIPTYGCRVDSAVAGSFVCVVEKNVFSHRSNSAKQFIGNFSFVPGMSAFPMKGLPDVVLLVISASGGVVFGVILALVLACIVMACCCIKRKRVAVKGQRGRSVGGDSEQEDGKGEGEPLLVGRINNGHQLPNQAMDYHTMVESSLSVRVIAEYGKGKTVSSLWNWGRGGSLRIPKVPEANYMLVVCMPDGNCVEIPLEVTDCVPNEVQATVEQNCAGTGPPSLPVEVTAETDPSVQSTISPVIPAAAPNPTAYLTEEEDGQDTQTAEIAWSADVTTNKTIGMLQVKPGTPYTLKVPPQQEEVVMKFTTFGKGGAASEEGSQAAYQQTKEVALSVDGTVTKGERNEVVNRPGEVAVMVHGPQDQKLFKEVQKQQTAFIDGVKLDGKLLGLMHQYQLLTKKEFNDINAYHLRQHIPDAGTYFVNSVMFQWSLEVFESKARDLIKALEKHEDAANHKIASRLRKAFAECGLAVPRVDDDST